MDEIQISILHTQPMQTDVKGAQGRIIPLVGVPDLSGHKNFFARHSAGLNCFAHALFIAINCRRVDTAITGLQCSADSFAYFMFMHLEDAKTEDGHVYAIVKGDGWYLHMSEPPP